MSKFLDTYFTLQYPSIDHITNKLKDLGPGVLLYKISAGLSDISEWIQETLIC